MAASNAVCLSNRDVESVATKVVQELGYESLKPEQLQIVTGVLRGRGVFGVLPTGFGKTLCFACLPSAYDKLYPKSAPSSVLVLSLGDCVLSGVGLGAKVGGKGRFFGGGTTEESLLRLAHSCGPPVCVGRMASKALAAFVCKTVLALNAFS